MDAIESYRLFKRSNAGLSTGVGAILAYGGLLWGSWYIVPFIVAIANGFCYYGIHVTFCYSCTK